MSLHAQPWQVAVVIPARNEARTIARCIHSVLAACDASSRVVTSWIVIAADRCEDDTVRIARQCLGARGEVLECRAGSPGTARRLGAAAALRHFAASDPCWLWLANTDADSHVPRDWIDAHLQHADRDAEAVAGIVQLDPDGLQEEVRALYARTYQIFADGTHPHVHGANFGVRADAYLAVGGWSDLTVSEDHCLWGRLVRRGGTLRSPAGCVVHTSARLEGRATGGFADTLRRAVNANA